MSTSFVTTTNTNESGDAVSSSCSLATTTAQHVLGAGGNAVDAAVAAAFTALVAQPERAGLGGDSTVLVSMGHDQRPVAINGQGACPDAATVDYFNEYLGLPAVPMNGPIAAAVPGTVGALINALEQWGVLPLRTVLEPAIAAAKNGVPVSAAAEAMWETSKDLLTTEWVSTPASVQLIAATADEPAVLKQPVLGELLESLLAQSEVNDRSRTLTAFRKHWYEGIVAEKIESFCQNQEVLNESGYRHGGLLTGQDLALWRPTTEPTVQTKIGHATVFSGGAWSYGLMANQACALLAGVESPPVGLPVEKADHWHVTVEAIKLALADGFVWAGAQGLPSADFVAADYVAQRRALIDADEASAVIRPGALQPGDCPLPRPDVKSTHTERARRARLLTYYSPRLGDEGTAVCVSDRRGMSVSIECVDGTVQGSPLVPGLGFALSTATARCSLQRGVSAQLRGGHRPVNPAATMMVDRADGTNVALASVGGLAKVSWLVQAVLRLADDRPSAQVLEQLSTAPVAVVQHIPSNVSAGQSSLNEVVLEHPGDDAVVRSLRAVGHLLSVVPVGTAGGVFASAASHENRSAAHDGRVTDSSVYAK